MPKTNAHLFTEDDLHKKMPASILQAQKANKEMPPSEKS